MTIVLEGIVWRSRLGGVRQGPRPFLTCSRIYLLRGEAGE